jgi:hypothetical protein
MKDALRQFLVLLIGIYCILALGWGVTYTKIVLFTLWGLPVFPSEVLCLMAILLVI